LLIAKDDPHLPFFQQLANLGNIPSSGLGNQGFDKLKPFERGAVCNLKVVDGVGCEMFAKMCYDKMAELLASGDMRYPINPTVRVKSVEVFEHGANSATYEG
jgi:hypothetical protein